MQKALLNYTGKSMVGEKKEISINSKTTIMKTLTVTTKGNKEIKIRFNEITNKIHAFDYRKLNDDNFEEGIKGPGFTDYIVGRYIIRKTYPTWITEGHCYVIF